MVKKINIANVSTFPPTLCGIGTYSNYLIGENWNQLAFDPDTYLSGKNPNAYVFTIGTVINISYQQMLDQPNHFLHLLKHVGSSVVIFQHTFSLYKIDDQRFYNLIKFLAQNNIPIVLSLHTVHFQSNENPSGMGDKEIALFKKTFPYVTAYILLTEGVAQAVKKQSRAWAKKSVVIRHGVHPFSNLSLDEAKQVLLEYLIKNYKGNGAVTSFVKLVKKAEAVMFGETGFYSQTKQSALLFQLSKNPALNGRFSQVIFSYFGSLRNPDDPKLVETRQAILKYNNPCAHHFVFDVYLPDHIFRAAMRIMCNIFWPVDCTQSGRLSHAQSVGALIIGKDIEGLGETLRMSGYPTFFQIEDGISYYLAHQKGSFSNQKKNQKYISEFSWSSQRKKHEQLATAIIAGKEFPDLDADKVDRL